MAVLSLPLSFNNSFWSQDYRKGLEVLFQKLDQGVAENEEIIAFIRSRIIAESQLAIALMNPMLTGAQGVGFGADDGASLLMTFRGLQSESAAQGQAHKSIAKELETLVVDPFDEWAQGFKERLRQRRHSVIDNWMKAYEQSHGEVAKLKHQYLSKTRKADEAEDDAKFAPNSNGITDNYTTSPRIRPTDSHRSPPQRTASVSERIAQRLKEIQKKSVSTLSTASGVASPPSKPEIVAEPEKIPEIPKLDKGKGKEVDRSMSPPPLAASPPPMSPMLPPSTFEKPPSPMPPFPEPPMLLAGLSLPPAAVSQLLSKAAIELNLRPVRVPLLGEYQDCFTGEEFVAWLNENVHGFGGSLDRAEEAAKDLTERDGLLRRIGEFGNQFEHSDDAFYQFRPKAFDIEGKNPDSISSPAAKLQPEALFKRTNNFVNLVSKALNAQANGEPMYVRARREAEEADKAYRLAVRKLDRQRLALEERLEDTLKTLQRWELERLRAVKTVLLQYQGTVSNLPKSLEPSNKRSKTLITAFQPESDLTALIERYHTGPFRPNAQVYESVAHDESDIVFGIDLRKWAEGGWNSITSEEEKKDLIPPVLTALLQGLTEAYTRLPSDDEKRKTWIYEVPLPAVHHLRETLNAVPPQGPIPAEIFTKYDAPVIASTIKLWLLELNPPIALYEGWEEFRKLYPTVGSAVKAEGEEQRIIELGTALQKLPRAHLYVLDAIIKHLKTLIDSTTVEEANEVYITKLALSISRTILRPKYESEISIQDRHPTLFFIDLVKNYDAILPSTIARKKRESERKIPLRKRTAPVDMRQSRGNRISVGGVNQFFAQQNLKSVKSPEKSSEPLPPPPTPPVMASPPPPPPLEEKPEPVVEAAPLLPPPPPPAAVDPDLPPRPTFKEPPTEDDDLPPRPTFKEPPPEPEDDVTPPMPKFVDPPPEPEVLAGDVAAPAQSHPVVPVSPVPSDVKRPSSSISTRSNQSKVSSRSPTPPKEDPAKISRSVSGGVKGPRGARGPRPVGGGTVSSMVSNLNRNSVTSSNRSASPSYKRLSGSPSRRPSSVLGRSAAFSRRTMASDAEDDVVDKK
ncbi:hypothetical protein DFS33DRAFT_1343865 [Desarmillaria ectypa]|nr:hypothetical protein DFS33DRAFT_1343865 [Desarmillaria ectypa]